MNEQSKLDVFKHHSRSWQDYRYVYPVISRRSRGLSIGINLNPDGACNFDCVYCCVDRAHPRDAAPVDVEILGQELREMLNAACNGALFDQPSFESVPAALRRLNDVAFSGDGEPTASPAFPAAVRMAALELQAMGLKDVKLVLITNATLLDRPHVADALELLDQCNGEIWAKMDAGTEAYYRLIDRTHVPFPQVLENILTAARKRPLVIQSMFLRFNGHPPSDAEIDAYGERLTDLLSRGGGIKAVHLYTIARAVADAGATPLSDAELDHIAKRLESLELPIEKFYSPDERTAPTV